MRIAGLQYNIAWEDKLVNFDRVRALTASVKQTDLLVLPEMFATGFSMNTKLIAEHPGGETERFLSDLARKRNTQVIAGVAVMHADGGVRNQALIVSAEGHVEGAYSKMRPFSAGGEDKHYRAGTSSIVVSCGDIRIAPFVCYDLRFPELFRQAAAAHRPELFVVIASWPAKRIEHWTRLLQARAIENQAYILGVNRVGSDPFFDYAGGSIICDFNGSIIADGGSEEGIIAADLDPAAVRKYREGLPFLNDLKPG